MDMQVVILALIPAGVQIVLALIARADRNAKARESEQRHVETRDSIEVVRNDVNGKMQELIQVSGDAREAKGNLAGRAEEKAGH